MTEIAFDKEVMKPAMGAKPALEFVAPAQLHIDAAYQRSIESRESQSLIRQIAAQWRWDLCQVLVVSRRDGKLYVIDGQHRFEAAKLRGDIDELPCIVGEYEDLQQEAAAFTAINTKRNALTSLDKFKGKLASGDEAAIALRDAIADAGLQLAAHTNWKFWGFDTIGCIGGLERSWRRKGEAITKAALVTLQQAFAGQSLRYAGTLFPGIVALCSTARGNVVSEEQLAKIRAKLGSKTQEEWRAAAIVEQSHHPQLSVVVSFERAVRNAMAGVVTPARKVALRKPAPQLVRSGPKDAPLDRYDAVKSGAKRFCEQCERLRTDADVGICVSAWCKLRDAAA